VTTKTDPALFVAEHLQLPDGSYPLQKQCPDPYNWEWQFKGRCSVCQATDSAHASWLPITELAAVLAAIRAKGWRYAIVSYEQGDECRVFTTSKPFEAHGIVYTPEGLRDEEAVNLAAARALGLEE